MTISDRIINCVMTLLIIALFVCVIITDHQIISLQEQVAKQRILQHNLYAVQTYQTGMMMQLTQMGAVRERGR